MVWVPGGEFSMGENDPPDMDQVGMKATKDARPVHRVYVDGFFMDKTDVTNAKFARFAISLWLNVSRARKIFRMHLLKISSQGRWCSRRPSTCLAEQLFAVVELCKGSRLEAPYGAGQRHQE
jgi:hypothetical protein